MNNTIKLVKHAAMCLIGLSLFVACEDELEDKTTNDWDASYVWTVADMAEGVLNKAYEKIPKAPDAYDDNYLDAATDNALTSAYGSMCYNLGAGAMTSKNNPLGIWKNTYNNFQYIHQFLMNGLREDVIYVRGSEEENQAYKQRLEGEAYFLRAYWGYRLLQVYGGKTDDGRALGYPIVTSFLTTEEMEHADLPRNTYEECALQIMEDCDKAASLLPLEYSGGDNIVGVTQVEKPQFIN